MRRLRRRHHAIREHADALDLGLDPIAHPEKLAERSADTLGRAGGEHVAGQ